MSIEVVAGPLYGQCAKRTRGRTRLASPAGMDLLAKSCGRGINKEVLHEYFDYH